MGTWSDKLDAYMLQTGMTTEAAMAAFGASSTSQIHAWRRDSEPRKEETLRRIEKKTGGLVPASAASSGRSRQRRRRGSTPPRAA